MTDSSPNTKTRPKNTIRSKIALAVASSFCGVISDVSAQTTTEQNNLLDLSIADLLSVKVTAASLFEESELDAASSITVLSPEEWNKHSPRRDSDVLESVPSVISYPTWGGAEAIAIRGYATELSVRGIANTLNGVPLNSYTYATSLYDKPIINLDHLDRIEMIRGPGSTLYGSDAFHGVMARQTRSESQETKSINATFGTKGFAKGSGFTSQHIQSSRFGKVSINTGFSVLRQSEQNLPYEYTSPDDGLLYSSDRDYAYDDKSAFLTISLGDEKDKGQWRFTNYYANFYADGYPSSGTQFFVKLPDFFNLQSSNITRDLDNSTGDSQFWLSSLNYNYNLSSSISLDAQIYHWTNKQQWSFENNRYPDSLILTFNSDPQDCLNGNNTEPTRNPLYCSHTLYQGADEHRSGVQLFLKGRGKSTQWVLGLGRDRFEIDNSRYRRIAPDNTPLIDQANPYQGDIRNITYGLAQAKSNFSNEKIQLVYGLRWDHYSDLDNHISPRLGIIYRVNEGYTSKLLYGHAYRAPTALEKLGSVDSILPNPDIKPEEIDTLEWVNVFYDQDYSLELTAFTSHWQEGIVLTPTLGNKNRYFNTGDNKSYGLEATGRKQLGRYTLAATGSYVRSKNKEFNIDYQAFPSWIFNFSVGRIFTPHNIEVNLKQRIMLNYGEGDYITKIDSTTGAIQEHIRPPAADNYYRTDLSITKHFSQLTASGERSLVFSVKNLFDQENEVASLYNAQSGIAEAGTSVDFSFRWAW